jgi:hypothetical protein
MKLSRLAEAVPIMANQVNQRTGVYLAIVAVLGANHGKIDWDNLPKEKKDAIFAHLQKEFVAGNIDLKGHRTPDWIAKYIPGLVNNWVRKDKRLNGDTVYVPKNPGSRQGSGDEQLTAMRALLQVTTDATARATIESEIAKRKVEIAPKPKEIKISALPEHLRHLVPVTLAGTTTKAEGESGGSGGEPEQEYPEDAEETPTTPAAPAEQHASA